MDIETYLKEIREFAVAHKHATDLYVHDVGYFDGHLPRFIATIEIFKEHLDKENIKIVHDLGTDVPFASLYFKRTQDAEVNCGCVDNRGTVELEPHDFCLVSGFRVIAEKITFTKAYGGDIMNVLLKKELYA